ncbi:MAG: Sushi domain-containing protein / SCR repeat-containing protein [Candidatus Adlerbacteria bacterium GW2011_GWB1_54_7]|uniref:Sushi domain-containing protein / SCR repeat-containing protein n=1 Tax=Candidatus Adlerbacteria bacterium GW2011_GWB1_54_7 TaxID=1618607 RepID=A0A0G2AY22_9BACT|nr:MAG: Sushi domain-containing protein / SCR repeat-containing protein [Candidatus Adlerbacteria bacterium GW2011_GWB1_54_7]
MALSWGGRRKLLYAAVAAVFGFAVMFGIYRTFFTAVPTCRDGAQNGRESGVDCGGDCALLCQAEARAPVVLWVRAMSGGEGAYTAAAYVQNQNAGAYAPDVHYAFQLFDGNNLLVAQESRTGCTRAKAISPRSGLPVSC